MTHWKPVDVVVATLTVVVGSVLVSSLFNPLDISGEHDEMRLKVYQGLFTAIMSVISLYVGARLQIKADSRDEEK